MRLLVMVLRPGRRLLAASNLPKLLMANSCSPSGLVTTCRQETSSQLRPRTPTQSLCTSIALSSVVTPSEVLLSMLGQQVPVVLVLPTPASLRSNRTTGASQPPGLSVIRSVQPPLFLALPRSSLCSLASEHDNIQRQYDGDRNLPIRSTARYK